MMLPVERGSGEQKSNLLCAAGELGGGKVRAAAEPLPLSSPRVECAKLLFAFTALLCFQLGEGGNLGVCVSVCVYREGRGLPDDRRGACCFLLGMLLQEFPLDFSCREQNSGRAADEPKQPDQITASSVSSALRAAALKCRSPARVEKSFFIFKTTWKWSVGISHCRSS